MIAHAWIVGPAAPAGIETDCHRFRRGPYTGLGALFRTLAPRVPQATREHAIELLSIAPELAGTVEAAPQTLASLAVPEERTRIYPPLRTRRLAHGAVDFLRSCADHLGPLTLSFTNVDEADPTDQEFLALLLRRSGERINVVVQTRTDELPDDLASALHQYARRTEGDEPDRRPGEPLQAYIDADGTSVDPAELAAYQDADPALRAELHEARAEAIRRAGPWSARLGAVPYHLERAGDPVRAVEALTEALKYCVDRGFYHAVIDYGLRARALLDPETQVADYWFLTAKTATSLAVLERPDEAEPLYQELRGRYTLPMLHMNVGYALGMVYTRYLPSGRKDHHVARTYVNNAIAIASTLADPAERAFNTVFNRNGLALIEMHLGNLEAALSLVTEGLERLERELPAGSHLLHKSVLLYNRAALLGRLGRLEEAVADYTAVIAADPNWQDYYFERADLLRRLGDPAAALADYDLATTITPPFWELHYNRGDLRAELGDLPGAVADLARVVALEPGELDPWRNLVGLLLESGELDRAREAIAEGLAQHPADPGLLCSRGQLSLETGDTDAAWRDFELALGADDGFVGALAGRAVLAFDRGDHGTALRDLGHAIEAGGDDPDLYYNRAQVLRAAGRTDEAIADYSRALTLPGADRAELLSQRGLCHFELGHLAQSRTDLDSARELRGDPEPAVS